MKIPQSFAATIGYIAMPKFYTICLAAVVPGLRLSLGVQ